MDMQQDNQLNNDESYAYTELFAKLDKYWTEHAKDYGVRYSKNSKA